MILGAASVSAQVRIGGNGAPNAGAVLDLNATDAITGTKGLALPRVDLTSSTMQLASGVTNLTGMLVYNTTTTLGTGIYFWDGSQWTIISGDGIVGNELTDTIAGGGLNKTGAGTAADPKKVGIKAGGVTAAMLSNMGATTNQILSYNGTSWVPTSYLLFTGLSIARCSTKLNGDTCQVSPAEISLPALCNSGNSTYSVHSADGRWMASWANANYIILRAFTSVTSAPTVFVYCFPKH